MTTYIVFEVAEGATGSTSSPDGNAAAWREIGRLEAVSSRAAISRTLSESKTEGTFVAVPARSWQPVKVQVETALKFS